MNFRWFCFLIIFFSLSINVKSQDSLIYIPYFGKNSGNLKLFIYSQKDTISKKPLIIALHGCNQTAHSFSQQTGWNKLANEHNFVIAYPEQKIINNVNKCFNWFLKNDINKDKGETGSIKSIIDYAINNYNIDTSQVFIYGLSAGAGLGTSIMANYPGTINSGAILAGPPYKSATSVFEALNLFLNCREEPIEYWSQLVKQQDTSFTENYPKLIVVQGENDIVVNPKNASELIKQWAYLTTDSIQVDTTVNFTNNADINKQFYFSKTDTSVIYYEVKKLGHQLMVDPGSNFNQGGNTGIFSVDKDFFSTYYIAKDFGIIK